jgi:ORF6N domain
MNQIIIPNEIITNKIYYIRGQKVMLDRDLAESRNSDKFPEHFMFRLNEIEVEMMIAEKAITSKQSLGGSLPYVFTEHGVLQLSNVLKSDRATQMSIKIIEVFC